MYEDVLNHRKKQMRQLDLASAPALVIEWTGLIAELDVVMRLNQGLLPHTSSPPPPLPPPWNGCIDR
jgi:hypothetical protein